MNATPCEPWWSIQIAAVIQLHSKGAKGALVVAAANFMLRKLMGSRTPLPTKPKWHMSTWAPYLSFPRKMAWGSSLAKENPLSAPRVRRRV